jgi:hypothetical protein
MSETSACPTMVAPTASVGHSRRLSHPIAFAAITAILILFTAASSAPRHGTARVWRKMRQGS